MSKSNWAWAPLCAALATVMLGHASAPALADPAITETTVSSTLNPSVVGQSVRFNAVVLGGGGVPTGNVTFKDGAATLGTELLDSIGASATPATGQAHSCAVTAAGGLQCWGYNGFGGLGDNSTTNSLTPVDVSGLDSGVTAVSGGAFHNCALTTAGGVKCWGRNQFGQLGDDSTNDSSIPVNVSGLSGVVAIAVGDDHSCALTAAGGVKCWGHGASGLIGDGTLIDRHTATNVNGLASGVSTIDAGTTNTCAVIAATGAVKCWGGNEFGQIGDGTTSLNPYLSPVDVSGLSGVTSIAVGGYHNCAVTDAGAAYCWGRNANGQVGDQSFTNTSLPVTVANLGSGTVAVSAGPFHSCALSNLGVVVCWGYNGFGQLGNNSTSDSNEPVIVSGVTGSAISAGYLHGCALTTSGGIRCWGQNLQGQLGNNTTTDSLVSVEVSGLGAGAAQVSARASFSTAALLVGDHTITAVYAGDLDHDGSTSSDLIQQVTRIATTTSRASSQNPSTFGDSVTFTATLSDTSATGTVTFSIDGTNQNPLGAVVAGVATFTTSALNAGDHTIVAVYNGDDNYFGSTSSDLTQTVDKAATTSTADTSQNSSVFGQQVTFTAGVSSTAGVPTGNVTVMLDDAPLAIGALAAGEASHATSAIAVGVHSVTVVYAGDANFAGSTSSAIAQTVNTGATTAAVASSHDPSKFGQVVTFTATVAATAPATGTPTGTATFMRGATTLGARALAGGSATLLTGTLAVGNHPITVTYGGNANFAASTSAALTQNVTKGASKTALTSTPKPSKPGKPVTLVATVTAVTPAKGIPTGNVAFKDGAKALGTKALVNGKATLPTKLAAGTHKLTAAYAGSASFAPAASPALVHPVKSALSGLAVVKLSDNGFVAAWEARDKERSTIHIRRYPADGSAGKDLPVTASGQDHAEPSVAGLRNGGFVVVWTGQDRSGLGVYGQRYNKAGTKLGAEFRVNASILNDQSQPSATALEDGGFVVAWASNHNAEAGFGVYARRYTVAGKAIGGELKISDTDGNQTYPSATALEHGGFVVAWQSDEAESSVRAQRYDTAGRKAGAEFAVSAAATDPSIATLADGGFVIAWTSGSGTSAQRFNANGAKRDGVLKISDPARDQSEPAIAAVDGGFVVVWTSQDKDGTGTTLRGQTYETAGKRLKGAFSAGAAPQDRSRPRATGLPGGAFVVLWTTPDGGLREQRFNGNAAD